jgi:hypothetical protein
MPTPVAAKLMKARRFARTGGIASVRDRTV